MPDEPRVPLPPSGPPLGGDRQVVYRPPPGWWRRHQSGVIATFIVLLLVGGVTGVVLATRNVGDVAVASPSLLPSSAVPFAVSSPAAPSTQAVPTGAVETTATGTVVAVLALGKWTVDFEKGLELTVTTLPTTKFPARKSAADVVQGSTITVDGTTLNGVVTAQSVAIKKKAGTT